MMLRQRMITALIGIPAIIFIVYAGNALLLAGVYLLVIAATAEFQNIVSKAGHRGLALPLWTGAIIFPLMQQYNSNMTLFAAFMIILFCGIYFLSGYPRYTPVDLGWTLLGLVYVVAGFSYLLLLRSLDHGFWLILYVFIVVWATDTGAYFCGIHLGKHKLAPTISPHKTWEGFGGGLIASILAVFVLTLLVPLPQGKALLYLTPLVSVAGQSGDLFESALKRYANLKDSSQLVPGHGGVLDRFDSALWACPLTYHILALLERLS